jgi:hypothetical protein
MLIHQLFKNIPDVIFINRLAAAFGLKDINDYSTDISILSMENAQTVKRINDMNYEIGNYYIQCKRDKYVGDWTPKKCITMFRQFLKIFNYSLVYKERFINGKKYSTDPKYGHILSNFDLLHDKFTGQIYLCGETYVALYEHNLVQLPVQLYPENLRTKPAAREISY